MVGSQRSIFAVVAALACIADVRAAAEEKPHDAMLEEVQKIADTAGAATSGASKAEKKAETPKQESPSDPVETAKNEAVEAQEVLMEKLTIGMGVEIVDGRTFAIRDSKKGGKTVHIRIGNVELSEGASEEKAKQVLEQYVGRQMLLWDAAPAEQQPAAKEGETEVIVADVWTVDGRHVAHTLGKGHKEQFAQKESYQGANVPEDFNILMAAADAQKKKSYDELSEAMKATQQPAETAEGKKQQKVAADLEEEPLGLGGILALMVVAATAAGAWFNFGRGEKKYKVKPSKAWMEAEVKRDQRLASVKERAANKGGA